MSQIYASLIIFPVMFFIILGFVFSSSPNSSVNDTEFLLNCPMPIQNGIGTPISIVGTTINYTVSWGGNIAYVNGGNATTLASTNGTFFNCQVQNHGAYAVNTIIKPYGQTTFQLPTGFTAYIGDTIGTIFYKGFLVVYLIFSFILAPVIVTGYPIFLLIDVVLLFLIGLGVIMIVAGIVRG